GRAREARTTLGRVRYRRPARDRLLALPRAHASDPALHRRARRAMGERRHHRAAARVRRAPLVGQHPPQPDRIAPQRAAPLPQGNGRDVAPVPPGVMLDRGETWAKDWTQPSPGPYFSLPSLRGA